MVGEPYRKALEERRTAEHRGALWLALVFAALLHYPLLHAALLLATLGPDPASGGALDWDVTEISLLDGLDVSASLTDLQREEALRRLAERDRNQEALEQLHKGQVVELPPQPDPRRPRQPTRHLAKHDSRTDRETQKMGDPRAARPKRAGDGQGLGSKAPSPTDPSSARETPRADAPVPAEALAMLQTEAAPAREPSATPRRASGRATLLRDGEGQLRIAPEIFDPPAAGSSKSGGSPPYSALLPPVALGGGGGGGGGDYGSDDYLPDVAAGDRTVLNARQFKYWGFFQRVKESIRRNWNPTAEYRRADPSGRVYGVRDRMTVLAVRLDRHGSLMDLSLREGSGVAPLDDEAMRAFRAAQPFPNPPRGLVAEDGTIEFSFGLFLDIRSGWEFRPLRGPALR